MPKLTAEIVRAVMARLGRKGGPARAKALTAARRREIARQGGRARWRKVR